MTQATELRELASLIRVNGGNVGIGPLTADPPYTLSLGQTNVAGAQTIRLAGNGNPKHEIQFREAGTGYGFTFRYAGDQADNKLHIVQHENDATGTEVMTFKRDSMEVGIGTASPDLLYEGLHIKSANPSLKIEGTGTNSWEFIHLKQPNYDRLIGMRTTGNIVINSGTNLDANNMLVISNSGKVGINVEYPDHDLDVDGAIATKQVRHSVVPTLNLDFANSKELDSRLSFYRNSMGSYYDEDGVVKYAVTNEPRFDHDPDTNECLGLLVERSMTNLIRRSQNMTQSSTGATGEWTVSGSGTYIIPNAGLAPDGTYSASRIRFANASHVVAQNVGSGFTVGDTVTASMWVKGTAGQTLRFAAGGTDFGNETLTGEWQRVSGIRTSVNMTLNINTYSGATARDVLIWGVQLEAGSLLTSYVPSQIRFSDRTSIATYYDENGIVRTAPRGEARYGYKYDGRRWVKTGLIVEGAGTNIARYSSKLDSVWAPSGGTVALDRSVTAPDGTDNVYGFTASTASGSHNIRQSHGGLTAGSKYTVSIWMKAKGSQAHAGMYVGGPNHSCVFSNINTTTPSITQVSGLENPTIVYQSNGWHRIEFTTAAGSGGNVNPIWTLRNSSTETFAGDGTQGVYLWGYQVEAGSQATSYISTLSQSLSRSIDVVISYQTFRDSDKVEIIEKERLDFYNEDAGTLYYEARSTKATTDLGGGRIGFSHDGSNNDRWMVNINSATYDAYIQADGQTTVNLTGTAPGVGVMHKSAIAATKNDAAVYQNGVSEGVDSSVTMPKINQFRLYNPTTDDDFLQGHFKKVSYYPARLPNVELQALTENN